ncbi:MAG: EcsC family protein [Acidocella sp.]|nr:EcsC family protein [Acidocella sp.]
MKPIPPFPESLAESAGFLTDHEQSQLWQAAVLMADSRGLLMRLTGGFGRQVEALRTRLVQAGARFGGASWEDLTSRAQTAVEDVLWNAYEFAIFGLEATPTFLRPEKGQCNRLHRLAATTSGIASGFVGLPGVLVDIPFTTTTILRSIAAVAQGYGEELSDENTRRACLEVLAFGGPGEADDEVETSFWAARLGLNHMAVSLLIKSAAGRFGIILSEKFLTQAVPVIGAVSGGALNYAFTDHYQKMARVHFCLRALERRSLEPLMVRELFGQLLKAARMRRKITRRDAKNMVYLPG